MKVGLISAVFALLCASLAIASTEAGVQPVLGKIYDDNGDAVIPAAKPWQQSIMNDLGKQLSPQGAVILPSDAERWDDVTVRWNMFKWPRVGHVVAAVEAGTTDDVKKAVSSVLLY